MQSPTISESSAPVASLTAFLQHLQHSSHVECAELPGLLRYHSQIPHPWFSGVIASRPPSGDESQLIQDVLNYFKNHGVESYTWWLQPGLSLDAWGEALIPLGFIQTSGPPGMVCDLGQLPEKLSMPEGFSVTQVQTPLTLDVWVKTFLAGYGFPGIFAQPFLRMLADFGLDGSIKHYLGYLNGEPVAAGSLFLSDGMAGIYNIGVVEKARRRGLGTAITLAPLLEARKQGCTLGVLQSSEMGFEIYQRLGFRKVCDVSHFYFTTSQAA